MHMDFSQLAEDAVMERSNARLFRLHGYTDYIHNARIILALYIYIWRERARMLLESFPHKGDPDLDQPLAQGTSTHSCDQIGGGARGKQCTWAFCSHVSCVV